MYKIVVSFVTISLGLLALTGCHATFQGTTVSRDGNGNGPTPAPGQAQTTSVSPSSATAGSAGLALTVTGLNFLPSTSVLWDDGTILATTYVSSTVLKAQVPASLLYRPMTVSIIPSPFQTFNFGTTFTVTTQALVGNSSFSVSKVAVAANDMEWNPVSGQIYLSVAVNDPLHPNSITTLNPMGPALGASVSTGTEPARLAVSSDGNFLYAGLNSQGSLRRYTLPTLRSDLDIPLGTNPAGLYYAIDLKAEPGNPRSVAVTRGVLNHSPIEIGGVVVYDDSVARPQSVAGVEFIGGSYTGPGPIDSLVWNPNGLSLYGIDGADGNNIYFLPVTAAGVQLQSKLPAGTDYFGSHLHSDSTTGNLYTDSGKVIDPATTVIVGSFPFHAILSGFNGQPIMVPDGSLNIAYFLGQTIDTPTAGSYALEAFDLSHFTFLGGIPITGISGTPVKMVRWGSNGLAILTRERDGTTAAGDGVYLVSGGFVTSPAP